MAKPFDEFNHPRPKIDFLESPSMTRQEFADEANVNNLLRRYALTGSFYDPMTMQKATRRAVYGDFTQFKDFQEIQNKMIEAQQAFDELPVEIRERFNYDPVKLVDFVTDEANRAEAEELGLIPSNHSKAASAATPVQAEAAPAATMKPASEGAGK